MIFDDILNTSNARFASLLEPAKKFNSLAVSNLEKLTQFHLDAAKSYADFGIEQLRAALSVTDAKSLQEFVSKQQSAVKALSEKLSKDAATLADLGKEFATEVQKLAQEQVAAFTPAGKKAA